MRTKAKAKSNMATEVPVAVENVGLREYFFISVAGFVRGDDILARADGSMSISMPFHGEEC